MEEGMDYRAIRANPEAPVRERMEAAYECLIQDRIRMMMFGSTVREKEERAKLKNEDSYSSAKNNNVREVLLAQWLEDDPEYAQALEDYREARDYFRVSQLYVQRCKALVPIEAIEVLAKPDTIRLD